MLFVSVLRTLRDILHREIAQYQQTSKYSTKPLNISILSSEQMFHNLMVFNAFLRFFVIICTAFVPCAVQISVVHRLPSPRTHQTEQR